MYLTLAYEVARIYRFGTTDRASKRTITGSISFDTYERNASVSVAVSLEMEGLKMQEGRNILPCKLFLNKLLVADGEIDVDEADEAELYGQDGGMNVQMIADNFHLSQGATTGLVRFRDIIMASPHWRPAHLS